VAVEGASAQSLNLYISQASGTKLDALYREAWDAGLKTTYYLRSCSATHVEKSTMKRTSGELNTVSFDAVAGMPLPMAIVPGDSS
jgi:ribonucleoside-diphosphate reductase alpha chain